MTSPEVASRIGRLYARMIFEQGFFQGDPHPGNLLVLPGTVIGLLDFGLAKELPPGFGADIAEMLTRGLAGDVPARRAGGPRTPASRSTTTRPPRCPASCWRCSATATRC